MRYFYIILFILFAAGCSEEKVPDTEAFKDEFTREFIKEGGETEDGYHVFHSKTGKYTFWFPENAKMAEMGYERNGNDFEVVRFGEKKEPAGISGKLTFDTGSSASDIESLLQLLSNRNGYEGSFKKRILNGNELYEAQNLDTVEGQEYYTHLIYIKHPEKSMGITLKFEGTCLEEGCEFDHAEFEKEKDTILSSIDFLEK
ncbi:hypothetical protein [Metabacillus sp. cB07]|uniref:hypothetical protein n=1 Tax=Metabacillus sp. cB07 TaxID=2806989 RepID=UPI0019398557|nr:hypothetical protein [Metabacillus sp. cB07]